VAQKESHNERTENAPFAMLDPTAFSALGKKRVEDFANAQIELLDKLQRTNRQWFDRPFAVMVASTASLVIKGAPIAKEGEPLWIGRG
jgi:hypothetical protein